jgi:hypothetical protein
LIARFVDLLKIGPEMEPVSSSLDSVVSSCTLRFPPGQRPTVFIFARTTPVSMAQAGAGEGGNHGPDHE